MDFVFYTRLKKMIVYESFSTLSSMILKVINLTHSLIKNLAIVGILDLRLTHETLRPLLISASAHQAYCIFF